MHQVLQADEARAIPVRFSQLQDQRLASVVQPGGVAPAPSSPGWSHLADAVEVLRRCMAWLEQWEHADHVAVHLRPASEEETECVPFDRPRVLRVLARIVADLEALTRRSGPLLRRPRYAAQHNPRPTASTVCALRRR
jgi:hypothetical protein